MSRRTTTLLTLCLVLLAAGCPTDPGDPDAGVDAGSDGGVDGGASDGGGGIPPWPATAADYDASLVAYVHTLEKPAKVGIAYDCCRDFGAISKDKIEEDRDDLDNAVAGFFDALGLLTGYSLQDTIDTDLASGDLMILFDHWGYTDADTPFVLATFDGAFAGSTTFTEAAAGTGTFLLDPASFLPGSGEPLTRLDATISSAGELSASGPTLPYALGLYGGVLELQLRDVEFTATADETSTSIAYRRGELSAYLTVDDFFAAINAYVADRCGCLGLTGELFTLGAGGAWVGACVTDAATLCDQPDESFCVTMGDDDALGACTLTPTIFPDAADLDLDGDPATFEALSLGLTWLAAPAEVVGLAP